MLDRSLNLLSHELLDTLNEDNSDEGQDDEGDDGSPPESISGGIGVVACVEGGAEDGGADAWDGFESCRVAGAHCYCQVCDGA